MTILPPNNQISFKNKLILENKNGGLLPVRRFEF